MKQTLIKNTGLTTIVVALVCLLASAAAALPTIAWTGDNFPSDISADGSVVVGNSNDGNYETFRWTALTGAVYLGMHTGNLDSGGGTPDVSDDGLRVSATIITADSLYATQGIWTKGIGWERSMPPIPPEGGLLGDGLGSAWGLSGDGSTLTGFFWRPGASDGSAHANTWNVDDGTFEHLTTPLNNCRGNDLSYDGSVVVGWSERFDGVWQPTVWENGGYEVLQHSEYWTEATGVSNDGNTIWGVAADTLTTIPSATIWQRTATGWDEQILGVLPGTFPGYGQSIVRDVAGIGNIAVGYNEFTWGSTTGFVWTLNEGMVAAADFFAAYGVTFPANFTISTLSAISFDGRTICGFGFDQGTYPPAYQGFVVTLDYVSSVPLPTAASGLAFAPNFPNPFNPSTTISLSLDREQDVRLDIFDIRGSLVRTLHTGSLPAGRNELLWDGRDNNGLQAASGMYFSRARGDRGEADSDRMMLVK